MARLLLAALLPALALGYPPKWACPATPFGQSISKTVNMNAAKQYEKIDTMRANLRAHRHLAEQQVPLLHEANLTQMLINHTEDVLVTFYAPWCPHCRSFVMEDETHDPLKAPLELFNKELVAANGPKAYKFDVTASQPPSSFRIEYVPMIFLLTKDGGMEVFKQDPHNLAALKAFAIRSHPAAANATNATNGTAALAAVKPHAK